MTIWVCSKCSHSFAIVKTKSGKFPLKVKNLERENTEEKKISPPLVCEFQSSDSNSTGGRRTPMLVLLSEFVASVSVVRTERACSK